MTPRRLGQHFLSDPTILSRIVDAIEPTPSDVVLEIGPGEGSLTAILLQRVRKVIAIEKDRRLISNFGLSIADCGFERLVLVQGDALKLDWHALLETHSANPQSAIRNPQCKVVGNIPYYITSPLLAKAMTPPLPERIVFLVQAEVADRMAAPPGDKTYGALSIGVQAVCRVEQLFTVAPGAFRPPPKVRSRLIRLTPLAEPLITPEEIAPFRTFVTACFSRRRKQLKNVVPDMSEADLRGLGFDPTIRPERLSPAEFVRLLRRSRQL